MPSNRPVQIIGAGLVGSLLSIYLEKLGIKTEIFEKRPDMRKSNLGGGRSINLAISTRGLTALEEVGLKDEVMKICLPMSGRAVHGVDGAVNIQPYSPNGDCIFSVSRSELNKILMTAAEKRYAVPISFEHSLAAVDFDSQKAMMKTSSGLKEMTGEIYIGTDGSASVVRESILEKNGASLSSEKLSYAYKEILIPAKHDGGFSLDPKALHIWPRKNFMLIALPNLDKSFTATLFLSEHGEMSFDQLTTPSSVTSFFQDFFPDAETLVPDLATQFFEHPTGHMVTIKLNKWSVKDRALILGDAAHAIVPFFGQGMNCGFEDCRILAGVIEKKLPWQKTFEEFFSLRKTNCDAIADLAQDNFIEMRDKVADPRFLFLKSVEKVLMKNFSKSYVSRYQLVSFSNIPYVNAKKIGEIEDEILNELAENLDRPESVDLEKAAKLINTKLKPELERAYGLKN